METPLKRYIVRKYIVASSARDALRKERSAPADECWVDEKWLEESVIRSFDGKGNKKYGK